MRPAGRRYRPTRPVGFEPVEPRIYLSGNSAADFQLESLGGDLLAEGFPAAVAGARELTAAHTAAAEYGLTGAGQTVVVIDSGIAYEHYALGGGFGLGYRVVGGYDFTAERDADPYDDGPMGSHGTHVAGIIAGNDGTRPGIAPGVDLVALRVFDDAGDGKVEWVERALRWVHDHRHDFANPITTVNLSLGTKWRAEGLPDGASFEDELARLQADGIFVAVAAGNNFLARQQPGLSYPAASSYVVPVASVDDDGSLSYFSQRARRAIAAPGRSVSSTVPDYLGNRNGIDDDFGRYSGTSMAAPYVAAASVLIRQAYQLAGTANVSQDTIYNLMVATADTVYDPITKQDYHRLNLDRAIDAVMPAERIGYVDWGSVRQSRFDGNRIDSGGQWFALTAANRGLLTVEAIFADAGADVDVELELFDADHKLLGTSRADRGHQRADVSARAGETFYLHAYARAGVNQDVDFRVTNLLSRQGKAVHVLGTGRSDRFTFSTADTHRLAVNDTHRLAVNDVVYRFDSTVVDSITFDGLGGFDRIEISGTAGGESAVFRPGSLVLRGPGYDVRTAAVQTAIVRAGGGRDRAVLYDSPGDDTFAANSDAGILYAGGFHNRAVGFELVQALSTAGGHDVARLYDSPGDDLFVANATAGRLSGDGFSNRARLFEEVHAYATSGGRDVAKLFDSPGDDTFTAGPRGGRLFGAGFLNQARFFDGLHAYATAGGHDVARLADSPGRDVLVVSAGSAALFGEGFYNRAKLFEEVHARADAGGRDKAVLHDSNVDDYFRAAGLSARLLSAGSLTWAFGFEHVRATAAHGGTNHTEIAAVDYLLELDGDWS